LGCLSQQARGGLEPEVREVGGGWRADARREALRKRGSGKGATAGETLDSPVLGGSAWIAVRAVPISGSRAPVSQFGAASSFAAQARRTWMNSRSRMRAIITADPCVGDSISSSSILRLTSSHSSDCPRAPSSVITAGRLASRWLAVESPIVKVPHRHRAGSAARCTLLRWWRSPRGRSTTSQGTVRGRGFGVLPAGRCVGPCLSAISYEIPSTCSRGSDMLAG
jgi:hypothetical protein